MGTKDNPPKNSKLQKLALVGNPNVGKSVLFNCLTDKYVAVSNYPGTTVEVSRGTCKLAEREVEVVDTPGMYNLHPLTEEERVARDILLAEAPDLVLHVVDAKNLERMLPLSFQLMEAGFPLVIVLNMLDEARDEGVTIDIETLEELVGVPVVGTVSTTGEGIDKLSEQIELNLENLPTPLPTPVQYAPAVEKAIAEIEKELAEYYPLPPRSLALLLLREDHQMWEVISNRQPNSKQKMQNLVRTARTHTLEPLEVSLAVSLSGRAGKTAEKVMTVEEEKITFRTRLSDLMMHPVTGLPILFLVLYLGLYKFVGNFGAGTVVDFIESNIFEKYVNQWLTTFSERVIPWEILRELFTGEYGVLTLGLRYAVAIVMPIVTFFFLVFAIIEDSGYLPRLALLLDRSFKKIGLSGRAVIPMVLGLGCATMATMVTRTLPTKRERILSTLLLALAVPCSAQLGVILALLENEPKAALVWGFAVVLIFLAVGYLGAKILPGNQALFYMEIPPLRLPRLSNVIIKTWARVRWYFKEVLPLFMLASVVIWLGKITHVFQLAISLLEKPVNLVGLPAEAASVFLFGFFRRDYGAAGLYDLSKQGLLTGNQLAVACVALTLFLPCIAQFIVNLKERGWKIGVSISVFVLLLSFVVAFIMNWILQTTGINL